MKKNTISAVVNTCNEEKYIGQCLGHLKWADEIVICDMYSTDKTVEICREFTDRIYFHERTISAMYARNFLISKADRDWILIVDPDEIIPESLSKKIIELTNSNSGFSAFSFPRKTICFGKWVKHTFPVDWQTRLFKKGSASQPARVHSQPIIKGKIHYLPKEEEFFIIHFAYDTIFQSIQKMNRFTAAEVTHMHKDDGVKFRTFDLVKKPLAEFKNRYFVRQGYKDGMHGFLLSILMGVYRFLTYAKLWQLEKRKNEWMKMKR